jgi:hypothetical protein
VNNSVIEVALWKARSELKEKERNKEREIERGKQREWYVNVAMMRMKKIEEWIYI